MKIAILAPPYLPVPPPFYGGTERIVSLLTEGLVKRGRDVTLFASGDSITRGKLVSILPRALGNSGLTKDNHEKAIVHYQTCYDRAAEFDLIHSHGQYLSLAAAVGLDTPVVFTWHGSFYPSEAPEEKRAMLSKHRDARYVTISNNQRGGMPDLNYVATVYNGLDLSEYPFVPSAGDYLLWVGRITKKKGPEEAIETAKQVGIRLEMAAAIDPVDRPYFDTVIRPRIDGRSVVFHGEVGLSAMAELYGGALAVLFPITWHEPFGLVMIEAMATGTPVIAYNSGSVPEIIVEGKTGFIVDEKAGVPGLVAAIARIGGIDRAACRKHVTEHFTVENMVAGYEQVYQRILENI